MTSGLSVWAVQMLLASTLLMVVVLALRGVVAKTFGPSAAYALWALPALRILTPALPSWLAPGWGLHVAARTMAGPAPPVETSGLALAASASPSAVVPAPAGASASAAVHLLGAPHLHGSLPWPVALNAVWLVGALVWFGWQMAGYRRFMRLAMRSARSYAGASARGEARDGGGVAVLTTDEVVGPVAAGVLRRKIFLPTDFSDRYAPLEQRLALMHERAHHRRGDLLANLAALAVVALHWWNPLAYRAYRAFRADQELACDAAVLAEAGAQDRPAYGAAILKSAAGRIPNVACAMSSKEELKQRLRALKWTPGGLRLGGVVATAMVAGGLLATASAQTSPPQTTPPQTTPPETSTSRSQPPAAPSTAVIARAAPVSRRPETGLTVARRAHNRRRDVRESAGAFLDQGQVAELARVRASVERDRAVAEGQWAQQERDAAEGERERALAQARQAVMQSRADADEGRREAAAARREALDAAAQAQAESRQAAAEARLEARQAEAASRQAATEARREAAAALDQAKTELALQAQRLHLDEPLASPPDDAGGREASHGRDRDRSGRHGGRRGGRGRGPDRSEADDLGMKVGVGASAAQVRPHSTCVRSA